MMSGPESVSSSSLVTERNFRQCLTNSLAAILSESGFAHTDASCLETLTELCQAFVVDLGRRSRSFSEIAGRSLPLPADVLLALADMGATCSLSTSSMFEYAFRSNRRSVSAPVFSAPPKPPSILHTGERSKHKHDSALPEYPDSHSYTRTATHKRPVMEYVAVREKAATQRRDVERALTHFVAKTSSNKKGGNSSGAHSLFNVEDANPFPLISTNRAALTTSAVSGEKLLLPSYLNALLFRDQAFEEDEVPLSTNNNKSVKKEDEQENKEGVKEEETESIKRVSESNPFLRQPKRPRTTITSSVKTYN